MTPVATFYGPVGFADQLRRVAGLHMERFPRAYRCGPSGGEAMSRQRPAAPETQYVRLATTLSPAAHNALRMQCGSQ